jgi:hypothetical protein
VRPLSLHKVGGVSAVAVIQSSAARVVAVVVHRLQISTTRPVPMKMKRHTVAPAHAPAMTGSILITLAVVPALNGSANVIVTVLCPA